MNTPYEDTGYIGANRRSKVRVPIRDYGNAARAEKAKAELRELLRELQTETEKLDKTMRVTT